MVFIRQHSRFIENFSIGLRYRTRDRTPGTITLVRYNGPHGESSREPGDHYARAHIHRVTARDIDAELCNHKNRIERSLTDTARFEQALTVFFDEIGVQLSEIFPELASTEASQWTSIESKSSLSQKLMTGVDVYERRDW